MRPAASIEETAGQVNQPINLPVGVLAYQPKVIKLALPPAAAVLMQSDRSTTKR